MFRSIVSANLLPKRFTTLTAIMNVLKFIFIVSISRIIHRIYEYLLYEEKFYEKNLFAKKS